MEVVRCKFVYLSCQPIAVHKNYFTLTFPFKRSCIKPCLNLNNFFVNQDPKNISCNSENVSELIEIPENENCTILLFEDESKDEDEDKDENENENDSNKLRLMLIPK